MTELKELRLQKNFTQKEAAQRLGVSLRSYVDYENDAKKTDTLKYRYLLQELRKADLLDEEHGLLSEAEIRKITSEVFSSYPVSFCYLFGSYAKGKATETSDVDLLIAADISGLRFYELAEKLRSALHKRVDLLDLKQLLNNEELLKEVLQTGIKIYG